MATILDSTGIDSYSKRWHRLRIQRAIKALMVPFTFIFWVVEQSGILEGNPET